MELRQDVLEFGGNRQAKVGGVLQYGNALIAQVEENDGGAQRAGVRSSKHLRVQDMPQSNQGKDEELAEALDEDEKGYTQMTTPGGLQQLAIVNEAGLYSLLFAMQPTKARNISDEYIAERQEKLRKFKRWVTHEVLPSIRKTGLYATPEAAKRLLADPDFLIAALQELKAIRAKNTALTETVGIQTQQIAEMKPKASYYDVVLNCKDAVAITTIAKYRAWELTDIDQIWAEALVKYQGGEELFLKGEVAMAAFAEQRNAMENDEREGMVLDYLETLLPESWDTMDIYRRIEYIRSPDDPTRANGSVRRNQVCVMEIWCECFGKPRESIKKADSYEIQGILNRIGGWSLFDGNKTGKKSLPIYGIQRMFVRTE